MDYDSLSALMPTLPKTIIQNRFLRKGDYWQLIFEGQEAFVLHTDGMVYIAALLAKPHNEIHVLKLQKLTQKQPLDCLQEQSQQKIFDQKIIQKLKADVENLEEIQADAARIAEAKEHFLSALNNQKQTFTDNGSKARDIVRKAMDGD